MKVEGGDTLSVSFDIRNSGKTAGQDVPQIYLTDAAGGARMRLIGWRRVSVQPGETVHVALKADPRLLADFDDAAHDWRIDAGRYQVALGTSAQELKLRGAAELKPAKVKP